MKSLRKMMALVFAMVMLVAMSVSTFAATITLTTQAGHTYEIYQVFTGEVSGDQLTKIKYGFSAADSKTGFVSDTDLAKLDEIIKKNDANEYANTQALIADLDDFVDLSKPFKTVAQNGVSSEEFLAGYYMIRDKEDKIPTDDDYKGDGVTLYMFQVLNDSLTISAKSGTVESEKKVDDNDSDGTLIDSADYSIGDTIPYTLTFKLPENYADYLKYYVKFNDTLSAGLTYNGDAKIYYGASDTAGTAIDFGTAPNLALEIENLKETAPALKKGDVITIKYTCYLNESAVIGAKGNPNTYNVEFNNNPNKSGKGEPTSTTPDDKNIVFTYKTIFDKIDENKAALKGADFKLEKKVDNEWVDVTKLNTSKSPIKTGSSAQNSTTFSFAGLDAGEYRLTETYTPAGYNTIDPIEFEIKATHDTDSDDPKLKTLEAEDLTMTASAAAGTLTSSIENKSGAVLPSTGGIGTTIFYVLGAILVVGAGVILVARRRVER